METAIDVDIGEGLQTRQGNGRGIFVKYSVTSHRRKGLRGGREARKEEGREKWRGGRTQEWEDGGREEILY